MPLKQLDTYLFSSQYCQKVAKDKNDKLTTTYIASTVPNRNNSLNLSLIMWRAWLMHVAEIDIIIKPVAKIWNRLVVFF